MSHALLRLRGALRPFLALALLLVVSLPSAQAATGFTILPSPNIQPGQSGVLSGTITNTGPDTVYYNGLSYQFLSAPGGAITDPNDPNVAVSLFFDAAAPFSLTGTADPAMPTQYTGALFDIFADSGAPQGNYTLQISLLGGPNDLTSPNPSNDVLATYTLPNQIGTAPVPEISTGITFGMMLFGLGVWSAFARRRRVRTL